MLKGILVSAALIFCQWHVVLGQLNESDKNPLVIGIKSHYGKILIHSTEVREIKNSYPLGSEVDLSWHKNKQKGGKPFKAFPRISMNQVNT